MQGARDMPKVLTDRLATARRLHAQRHDSKNKLCALHAPDVERIRRGKTRTPYEFGVKISVAMTASKGLMVAMCSMPGNRHDGYMIDSAPE